MSRLQFVILLSSLFTVTTTLTSFNCPSNFPCYCMRSDESDDNNKYKVHCSTSEIENSAFDLSVQTSDEGKSSLRIQCVNSPDWSDFLLGSRLYLGEVDNFQYVGCELPGGKYSDNVLNAQLSVHGVQFLRIDKLRANVSRADFDVFPQLRRLQLTGNRLGSVPRDLLHGLLNLTQLELRSTQIQLPPSCFFRNSANLVSLELSQNDLYGLQPGIFDGLDKLQLLNIWACNLSSIHPHLFRGLKSLVSLDIKSNGLQSLPADVFNDLTSLKIVNFGMNNFTELPSDLFKRNRALRVVKIMYNRANISSLPDEFLGNLPELKIVSLERASLLDVPENLFWGSDSIVELNVNRNYLRTLPVNLLRDARQLHKLGLSFNDLRELPDRLFASLQKLVSLDLSRNHLSTINDHLFEGLDSLQELNIERNDLKYIDVDAFVSLTALRIARFSHNHLTCRTDVFDIFGQLSPFHGCSQLEELYLSHNNVSEIYGDWTVAHVKLRKLDLSYNDVEYLQTEDLQFVSDKLTVDLRYNAISTIDLTRLDYIAAEQNSNNNTSRRRQVRIDLNFNPIYCDCQLYSLLRYTNGELKPVALDFVDLQLQHSSCDGPEYMKGTRLLSLKAPELKCVLDDIHHDEESENNNDDACSPNGPCDCWLKPVDRTLILDCAARNLSQSPVNIVLGNSDYVEIDLSGNQLIFAPSLTGNGYEKVRSLNLAGNRISYVNESLISQNLKILKLEGNELTYIDDEILEKIASKSNISQLSLHDNPWHCDCHALGLLDFVQNRYQILTERHNINCFENNRSLSILQPADLCPYHIQLIVITCALVAILALIVGASAALFFYYQRQIKVYLYSKNLCLWFITEDELDKDKVWDAFVSYSHRDEEFVVEKLVRELENGPKPYKICIHGRDWVAGEWIPSNIQRSVEGSRRTIIVLSPHFIDSEWGKLEFQAAHKKALSDKCTRVIVVLYGDIDPTNIDDPELRGYLQMNTYVKWGDPWFYQKLRYALPHKQLYAKINNDKENLHVAGHNEIVQVKIVG